MNCKSGWTARKGEWLELTLPAPPGSDEELMDWLQKTTPVPAKLLRKLKGSNGIVRIGRKVRLRLFPPEKAQFFPEWREIAILYEDDFCLVAGKEPGMNVHPAFPGQQGSLANAVAFYYQSTGQDCRVRHIHRLDKDTSGAVLYAKNELAQLVLDEAMKLGKIKRGYLAVVAGRMDRTQGRIDAPIGRDRHHPQRRRVTAGGDPASTRYEVIDRCRDATLVKLWLETGRTHQIRVHLSYIGHPVWGDVLYGGPADGINRQALHGKTLTFSHPWTAEPLQLEMPEPEDFRRLAENLRLRIP